MSLPLHDVTSRRLKLTVSRHFKHALESAFYDNHFIGSNKSICPVTQESGHETLTHSPTRAGRWAAVGRACAFRDRNASRASGRRNRCTDLRRDSAHLAENTGGLLVRGIDRGRRANRHCPKEPADRSARQSTHTVANSQPGTGRVQGARANRPGQGGHLQYKRQGWIRFCRGKQDPQWKHHCRRRLYRKRPGSPLRRGDIHKPRRRLPAHQRHPRQRRHPHNGPGHGPSREDERPKFTPYHPDGPRLHYRQHQQLQPRLPLRQRRGQLHKCGCDRVSDVHTQPRRAQLERPARARHGGRRISRRRGWSGSCQRRQPGQRRSLVPTDESSRARQHAGARLPPHGADQGRRPHAARRQFRKRRRRPLPVVPHLYDQRSARHEYSADPAGLHRPGRGRTRRPRIQQSAHSQFVHRVLDAPSGHPFLDRPLRPDRKRPA